MPLPSERQHATLCGCVRPRAGQNENLFFGVAFDSPAPAEQLAESPPSSVPFNSRVA